ncbi:MAG: helix-turn-helix transcriptional regulator [Leptolyngbya sp. SIO1E4]|nr:helix-turn-helix transcriptional regulator [Leptolyngbya sp. SIO1E4]
MSLDLTATEFDNIYAEAEHHCPPATSADDLETIYTMPSQLGCGYCREIELCSGLDLAIFHETYSDGFIYRGVENPHPVQFMVHLSGTVDSGSFLYQDSNYSYVGGSGIQPAVTNCYLANQPLTGVDIHLQPHLLRQLFATPTVELLPEFQPLVQGDDWQQVFSPKVTRAMRAVVQQIIDCPFMGTTKRLYLQSKVFELMALQLDGISNEKTTALSGLLKADTAARIHYAAEILRSHLENPPSNTELAQRIGIGLTTLNKGFWTVFGVTPFAYLTRCRMEQAERLLRQPDCTVAEVANQVGYANPAQFAAVFKRQFGMTPRECMRGSIHHQP